MKSNDKPLKDVVQEILRKYRLEGHLEETKLIEQWPGICGNMIAAHTSVRIRDNVLFVNVDSAALRQELMYMKETLMLKLNKTAGRELIKDIVLR
jgi:predicted nucleic acid-binding Zn ribbon protein